MAPLVGITRLTLAMIRNLVSVIGTLGNLPYVRDPSRQDLISHLCVGSETWPRNRSAKRNAIPDNLEHYHK